MKSKHSKSRMSDVATAAVSAVAALRVVHRIEIMQNSMEDTLRPGDRLFVNKLAYTGGRKPERGDIVIFRSSLKDAKGKDKILVKRIIGLPGDEIRTSEGNVYINGQLVREPYVRNGVTPDREITVCRVPKGTYFCMGDNRSSSIDSRSKSVGCIPMEHILGRVIQRNTKNRK